MVESTWRSRSQPATRRWRRAFGPSLVLLLLLASAFPVLATTSPWPAGTAELIENAEVLYEQDLAHLATGDPAGPQAQYPWPFALESIGHTIESYQRYGGSPYFHHGTDVMAPAGTQVYNRSGGQVVEIVNYQPGHSLYWRVAVLDPEGYVWQYHHIDQPTIPTYVWNKYYEYLGDPINGGFIPPDTHVGNIVWWPAAKAGAPTNFHHIHLNILDGNGHYASSFLFHEPLPDASGPTIQAIGLLKNGQIYPGNTVEPPYGLYVRSRDLIMAPNWYWLPPYEVKFSINGEPDITVWRFDNIPGGGDRYAYVTQYYVVPPTCGDYNCNDFYVNLGFIKDGQRSFPSIPGTYNLAVTVRDFVGNVASGQFNYTVLGACVPPSGVDFSWQPASLFPGDEVTFTGTATGSPPLTYSWVFGDGGTGSGNPAAHTYGAPGDYPITLTVSNACGQAQQTHTVTVHEEELPPPDETLWINRMKMNGAAAARPGWYKAIVLVRVYGSGLHAGPIAGADSWGTWTYPGGAAEYQQAVMLTDLLGRTKFRVKAPASGLYQFCVDVITKDGYLYDPDANQDGPCMSMTILP